MPSMPEVLKVAGQELTVSTERTRHAVDYGVSASPVGSWTHVALTFDGAMLRLFVNGVQVSSRAISGSVQSVTNPLWIGGNQPYGEFFHGLIDEARVYNRALSVAELQTVMNGPLL